MSANTPNESTAVATVERAPTGRDLVLHADNLNAMVRVADLMANSRQMVPKHLRGNPGGCMAVTMQAMRWNMDPFALAVKTYTVDAEGPVAYEGQAIIAALNNSPLLATRLSFEWEGPWERIVGRFKEVESKKKDAQGNQILDARGQPKKYIVPAWDFNTDEEGLKVTVSATLVGETKPRVLELLMKQARTRNSPLWTEDPKQQLAYLAGRRWGRLHAPDVIMGVYTPDELAEISTEKFMGPADVVGAPPPPDPPAQKVWPEEDFSKQFARWSKAVSAGLKTVDEILTMARTKGALTPEQEAKIRALVQGPAQPAGDDIVMTYAQVADRLTKADTLERLDEAAGLIQAVAGAAQQAELQSLYETRRGALG